MPICSYLVVGTAKFFGVDSETEDASRALWNERRRRLAIKRFGGVRDEFSVVDSCALGGPQVNRASTCALNALEGIRRLVANRLTC